MHRWSAFANGDDRPDRYDIPIVCAVTLEIDLVSVGVLFETGDESPEQPGRGRAEHAEPELLDVPGARVVAGFVDNRIDPCPDDQRRCVGERWGRAESSTTVSPAIESCASGEEESARRGG